MASSGEIEEVRLNTDEPVATSTYDDVMIGSLIDLYGIAGASSRLWDAKAAAAAKLVDVTEAGASHKLSHLFDHAKKLSEQWAERESIILAEDEGRIRIRKAERS